MYRNNLYEVNRGIFRAEAFVVQVLRKGIPAGRTSVCRNFGLRISDHDPRG